MSKRRQVAKKIARGLKGYTPTKVTKEVMDTLFRGGWSGLRIGNSVGRKQQIDAKWKRVTLKPGASPIHISIFVDTIAQRPGQYGSGGVTRIVVVAQTSKGKHLGNFPATRLLSVKQATQLVARELRSTL